MNRHSILPKNQANSSVSPEKVLIDFGITYRSSGRYMRIPAIWRGSRDFNISIHRETGYFIDFAGGERGSFRKLLDLIGADPEKIANLKISGKNKKYLSEKREREQKRKIAEKILTGSTAPLPHSPAFRYLSGRGIPDSAIHEAVSSGIILQSENALVTRMDTIAGEFEGIHRIYVTEDGMKAPGPGTNKETKQMLGGAGYTFLPGSGTSGTEGEKILAVGEGLETCLVAWAALDCKAAVIVSYNAGNLEKLDLDELDRNIRILILVDRDKPGGKTKTGNWQPGRGQEASRRLALKLIKRGFTVSLAVPPPVSNHIEKSDWLDVFNSDREICRDLLQKTILNPIRTSEEVRSLDRLSPGENTYSAPGRISLQVAQEQLAELFNAPPAPGARLIAVDMGVGKTRALASIALKRASEEPSLIVVPTVELAEAYEKAGIPLYRGRNQDEGSAGFCQKFPDLQDLGENRRSIMAHECRTCPHGLVLMADRGSDSTLVTLGELGINREEFSPCQWLSQITDIALSPVVVATMAALQGKPDHLLNFEDPTSFVQKTRPRRIFFDDCFNPFDTLTISVENIGKWVSRIEEKISTIEDEDQTWLRKMKESLAGIAGMIGSRAGEERITLPDLQVPSGFESWEAFAKFIRSGKEREKVIDGLSPEKVTVNNGKRDVPLRALLDLSSAIMHGTVWIEKGILGGTLPTLAYSLLTRTGTTILDATPSPAICKAIHDAGGTIHEIRVNQPNLRIVQLNTRIHGRSSLLALEAEIRHARRIIEDGIRKAGHIDRIAFLSHKPLIERIHQIYPGLDCGWFGRDERGHDRWNAQKGKTLLIIFGIPLRPNLRDEFEHMNGYGWRQDRDFQAVPIPYNMAGRQAAAWGSLPLDNGIREWERQAATAEVVQAIGRLRAVRAPYPVEVWIDTSYPLAPLCGLEIHDIQSEGGRTGDQYQESRWEDTRARFEQAVASGGNSFRAINRILISRGLKTLSPESYKRLRSTEYEWELPEEIDMAEIEKAIDAILSPIKEEIMKEGKMDREKAARIERKSKQILADPGATPAQVKAALILLESIGRPVQTG